MIYNRYYNDYESDYQYELRTTYNKSIPSYRPIYLTPSGEWYYNEPIGDYIVLEVLSTTNVSDIDKLCRLHMSPYMNPF